MLFEKSLTWSGHKTDIFWKFYLSTDTFWSPKTIGRVLDYSTVHYKCKCGNKLFNCVYICFFSVANYSYNYCFVRQWSGNARKYGPSVLCTYLKLGNFLITIQIFCSWAVNVYRINVECFYCTFFSAFLCQRF